MIPHRYRRLYPGIDPPDWLQFRDNLRHKTNCATVKTGKVTLNIDVTQNTVEITDFDIGGDDPPQRILLAAHGILQIILRETEQAEIGGPRLIVHSNSSEQVAPLLIQEGFTVHYLNNENEDGDEPSEIVGVIPGPVTSIRRLVRKQDGS